jgi:hypothetical protein
MFVCSQESVEEKLQSWASSQPLGMTSEKLGRAVPLTSWMKPALASAKLTTLQACFVES